MKKLKALSWKGRGTGGARCTAEVGQPIRGYRIHSKANFNPHFTSSTDGTIPTVSWISFDGDIYWVELSKAPGWPRTIRVTQNDVDGVRFTSKADDDD